MRTAILATGGEYATTTWAKLWGVTDRSSRMSFSRGSHYGTTSSGSRYARASGETTHTMQSSPSCSMSRSMLLPSRPIPWERVRLSLCRAKGSDY